jgi:hypothetical protein
MTHLFRFCDNPRCNMYETVSTQVDMYIPTREIPSIRVTMIGINDLSKYNVNIRHIHSKCYSFFNEPVRLCSDCWHFALYLENAFNKWRSQYPQFVGSLLSRAAFDELLHLYYSEMDKTKHYEHWTDILEQRVKMINCPISFNFIRPTRRR